MRRVPEMPHGRSMGSAMRACGMLDLLAAITASKACMPELCRACTAAATQTKVFCMRDVHSMSSVPGRQGCEATLLWI